MNKEFKVLLRSPVYPVIIIDKSRLLTSDNLAQLANNLMLSTPFNDDKYIKIIDSSGNEFWYETEMSVITPGFLTKKWTKRNLIDLYNNKKAKTDELYKPKSLSNKSLKAIISSIYNMIRESNN